MTAATLILALGSPVLGDDGVGPAVADALEAEALPAGVEVERGASLGLGLLEMVRGRSRLVLLDAVDLGLEPGAVVVLSADEVEGLAARHTRSSHEPGLGELLALGRRLGEPLPGRIELVGVQVAEVGVLSESLSPPVAAAVAAAAERVRALLAAC